MFSNIKEIVLNIIKSRLFVMVIVFTIMFAILIERIFQLQIVNGESYLNDFAMTIKKERTIASTRGNIFDRNGNLLAYNELAYSVTIEDNGTYANMAEKNRELNSTIYKLIKMIEKNGDSIINDFNVVLDNFGNYSYTVSDRSLLRFLADIYGQAKIEDLKDEYRNISAKDLITYLRSEKKFNIGSEYSDADALKILNVRYAMSANSYQKYLATTVASDVSDETVAVIMENKDSLQGVSISEDTIRRYVDSVYFSHLIGYTGKISQDELDELQKTNSDYALTDVVGKSGIEQVMETQLQGQKGYETVYVDNLGKVIETAESSEPEAGNDVYLTIDKDLQEVVYRIIEQTLAGILIDKIENIKEYVPTASSTASDIKIPIDDVYYALINNNVIDITHFTSEDACELEKSVYQKFVKKQNDVIEALNEQLLSDTPLSYADSPKEMQVYYSYITSLLSKNSILISSNIDSDDETYMAWKNETISLKEYLTYAITHNWIDNTKFETQNKYSDSDEIYNALLNYIYTELKTDLAFSKKLYKFMIKSETVYGPEICLLLFEQGILEYDEAQVNMLKMSSAGGAYNFIIDKINNLEITPAQLALDPCSGSMVITDVNSGDVLACVTYPSYDNNKIANNMDAAYYSSLLNDLSYPLINRATQQKTAPGSTFKMVSAIAGLEEGVITTGETIQDAGIFDKLSDQHKCWIYPSNHGIINVSEAIRDSCNYFFYEVGYRLSTTPSGQYSSQLGIDKLAKYAKMFGLGEKSGIEITESEPQISTEYPVISAIGQGTNNYTNVQLSKYVTTVANRGTCYNLTLLDKLTDSSGNVIEEYSSKVYNKLDNISQDSWNAVQSGMRMVIEHTDAFKDFPISVAGKTGTAQESKSRPNHALFVCFAPFENPEISMSVQMANGYTSANAAEIAREVLKYYFEIENKDEIINGTAMQPSANVIAD